MNDLLDSALGLSAHARNPRVTFRASRILERMGFERRRRAASPIPTRTSARAPRVAPSLEPAPCRLAVLPSHSNRADSPRLLGVTTPHERQPLMKPTVGLNLPKPAAKVGAIARSIVTNMTGHPLFPSPTPSLTRVTEAADAAEVAEVRALSRARGAREARNAKLAAAGDDEGRHG